MRRWLEAEGFTEVDPAALQVSPGNETHLHAFATERVEPEGGRAQLYLHTSPEFAMKKLLAAGEERIAAFAHVWRNRDRSPLHAAEFTMLEWYRVAAPYEAVMADAVALVRLAAEVAAGQGPGVLRWQGAVCDPAAEPLRLSVAEAFAAHAGIDLLSTIRDDGSSDAAELRREMGRAGIRVAGDDGWSDMFSRALVQAVEPALDPARIVVLDRYPAPEAALARRAADDPRVAERFEVYACGVELANGFGELTDPAEQRRRFEAEMDAKARLYGERYPLDEEFLAALAVMPEASGIALGFDRLVLLATGAPRIEEVQWVPAAG